MSSAVDLTAELRAFAEKVKQKLRAQPRGDPEAQLRGPLEFLINTAGSELGFKILAKDESALPDVGARPDYAVLSDEILVGHIELKPPGTGARTSRFKGHNRAQWQKLKDHPNLLYTDGNEWAIYRKGLLQGSVVAFNNDIAVVGADAVTSAAAGNIRDLLRGFFQWEPIAPTSSRQLAETLAPLCRMLRDDVVEAMKLKSSKFAALAADWRDLLFREASDSEFADAYAQTVTYGLLLARSEGANTLDMGNMAKRLQAKHLLLGRALEVLTDPTGVRPEVDVPVSLLQRVIAAVPHSLWKSKKDPWLYFYEEFLAAYDPRLRKNAGVYYTPVEVVQAQVRLIDHLLVNWFSKPLGFAEEDVVTLDPAVGTGTYLVGVMEHAAARVAALICDDQSTPNRDGSLVLRFPLIAAQRGGPEPLSSWSSLPEERA